MKKLPPFLRRLTRMCFVIWACVVTMQRPVRPSVRAQDLPVALFRRCRLILVLCCLLCTTLSTTSCTLGPTVETRYVIVHPGQPLRAMANQQIDGERMDGAGVVSQDVGGWVMMPPDHWAVIDKLIKQAQQAPPSH